jgi:hypothetical protein
MAPKNEMFNSRNNVIKSKEKEKRKEQRVGKKLPCLTFDLFRKAKFSFPFSASLFALTLRRFVRERRHRQEMKEFSRSSLKKRDFIGSFRTRRYRINCEHNERQKPG